MPLQEELEYGVPDLNSKSIFKYLCTYLYKL